MDLFRKTQKKDVHDSEILNAVAGTLKISLIEMNELGYSISKKFI